MAFHDVDYDVGFVLGDPESPPLWGWAAWASLCESLDPLIAATRGKAAVRSLQYLPERGGTVKFGRIGWNVAGHRKWNHGSPTNRAESSSWGFCNVEVWARSWTSCEREGRPPDVDLGIGDESFVGGYGRPLSFNPVVVLAVEIETALREAPLVAATMACLRSLTGARLVGARRRPWGIRSGANSFTHAIPDLVLSDLFRPGPRHGVGVGFHLLAEEWAPRTEAGIAPPP